MSDPVTVDEIGAALEARDVGWLAAAALTLLAEREQLHKALSRLEWIIIDKVPRCLVCSRSKSDEPDAHQPECVVGKALRGEP